MLWSKVHGRADALSDMALQRFAESINAHVLCLSVFSIVCDVLETQTILLLHMHL